MQFPKFTEQELEQLLQNRRLFFKTAMFGRRFEAKCNSTFRRFVPGTVYHVKHLNKWSKAIDGWYMIENPKPLYENDIFKYISAENFALHFEEIKKEDQNEKKT